MIQDTNYKDSVDGVLAWGVIHFVMAWGLTIPAFSAEQARYQMTSTILILVIVGLGFYYYRFKRTVERQDYLTWRMVSMGLITLSGLQYCFYALYQSAGQPRLFYAVACVVVVSFVLPLLLRLKNDEINLEAALEDGRFRQDGSIDYFIRYRPLPLPASLIRFHINKPHLQVKQPKGWFYGLIGGAVAMFTPFLKTGAGSYIIGGLMALFSYYYAITLLYYTLDWVFYKQLQTRLMNKYSI